MGAGNGRRGVRLDRDGVQQLRHVVSLAEQASRRDRRAAAGNRQLRRLPWGVALADVSHSAFARCERTAQLVWKGPDGGRCGPKRCAGSAAAAASQRG